MHIVEYWIHDVSGDLDCREGREWRAVRRWIAKAENEVVKGDADGMVSVERVERHFESYNHMGEPEGDFDNEHETVWTHPDWDDMNMDWRRP